VLPQAVDAAIATPNTTLRIQPLPHTTAVGRVAGVAPSDSGLAGWRGLQLAKQAISKAFLSA
jgi:hypothetical protein